MAKAIRAHIKENPEDFASSEASDSSADDDDDEDNTAVGSSSNRDVKPWHEQVVDGFLDAPENPAMLLLLGLILLLLLSNIYFYFRSGRIPAKPIADGAQALAQSTVDRLDRVERQIETLFAALGSARQSPAV